MYELGAARIRAPVREILGASLLAAFDAENRTVAQTQLSQGGRGGWLIRGSNGEYVDASDNDNFAIKNAFARRDLSMIELLVRWRGDKGERVDY